MSAKSIIELNVTFSFGGFQGEVPIATSAVNIDVPINFIGPVASGIAIHVLASHHVRATLDEAIEGGWFEN